MFFDFRICLVVFEILKKLTVGPCFPCLPTGQGSAHIFFKSTGGSQGIRAGYPGAPCVPGAPLSPFRPGVPFGPGKAEHLNCSLQIKICHNEILSAMKDMNQPISQIYKKTPIY